MPADAREWAALRGYTLFPSPHMSEREVLWVGGNLYAHPATISVNWGRERLFAPDADFPLDSPPVPHAR